MFKVSVMYPNQEGKKFDHDYYCATHITMAERLMGPFGLVRTAVEKGIPGPDGTPSPYVCIGHLYFDSADGYKRSIEAHGDELRADFPNYTEVQPVRQMGEMLRGE